MSEEMTGLALENTNPGLRTLLQDMQKGHIRVPRFHTQFVWDDRQRLELLDSIRKKIPIGSLLVWRTYSHRLASYDEVGGRQIALTQERTSIKGREYLLDGHQRIATLLSLLLPLNEQGSAVSEQKFGQYLDWDIQYDLVDDEFVFARCARPDRPLLPLHTLLDMRLVNKFMRKMSSERTRFLGWEEFDAWERRADQLAYRFQEIRIPVFVMVAENLELVKEAMLRVGGESKKSEVDWVSALAWDEQTDLLKTLDELRSTFPPGWQNSSDELILQICKWSHGLGFSRSVVDEELIDKINKQPGTLKEAAGLLQQAIALVTKILPAVIGESYLPYSDHLSLLALIISLHRGIPLPLNEAQLKRWILLRSWEETFASSAHRRIKIELEGFMRGVVESRNAADNLPTSRMDMRTARFRLLLLNFAEGDDLTDHEQARWSRLQLLRRFGSNACSRLLPDQAGASDALRRLLQGIANQVFYPPDKVQDLLHYLQTEPAPMADLLKNLFITPDMLDDLRAERWQEFLDARYNLINQWDQDNYARVSKEV